MCYCDVCLQLGAKEVNPIPKKLFFRNLFFSLEMSYEDFEKLITNITATKVQNEATQILKTLDRKKAVKDGPSILPAEFKQFVAGMCECVNKCEDGNQKSPGKNYLFNCLKKLRKTAEHIEYDDVSNIGEISPGDIEVVRKFLQCFSDLESSESLVVLHWRTIQRWVELPEQYQAKQQEIINYIFEEIIASKGNTFFRRLKEKGWEYLAFCSADGISEYPHEGAEYIGEKFNKLFRTRDPATRGKMLVEINRMLMDFYELGCAPQQENRGQEELLRDVPSALSLNTILSGWVHVEEETMDASEMCRLRVNIRDEQKKIDMDSILIQISRGIRKCYSRFAYHNYGGVNLTLIT